jgi:hypothetical protein
MKVKDTLDNRGIEYKELKEKGDRFTVLFNMESDKRLAMRALLKDDHIVTSEDELKLTGIKKKEPASDNADFDVHSTDPSRLKSEVKEVFNVK